MSEAVAAAGSEKARAERAALLASIESGACRAIDRVVRVLPKAAAAYKATVAEMGCALGDERYTVLALH